MANCTKCGAEIGADTRFCPACGAAVQGDNNAQYQNTQYQAAPVAPAAPPAWDHTAEFDPKDISDNKVLAMLGYLMGWLGVILQLLASNNSPYVKFHMRQTMKLMVVNVLLGIVMALLFWTVIVPIAGAVMMCVFYVINIICFFQVCSGKAKEPAIIRSLGFFK